jgi:hypothetical protein
MVQQKKDQSSLHHHPSMIFLPSFLISFPEALSFGAKKEK